MGKNQSKSYQEQENAIKQKQVSFDLNIYFIGEEISFIYQRFEALKSKPDGGIFCFWNYFYHKGDYESQLKEMSDIYKDNLEKFETDPVNNTFKEVIIIKMKEKNDGQIQKIFDIFASDKIDVYCPFIIFFFDIIGNDFPKVKVDENNYYISPLKVFTFKYDTLESKSIEDFHKCLYRICSYYNELGDQLIIWPKDSEEPMAIDLINSEFNSFINIFCLGKTGSGKSTFLNKFFGEKKSKQGGTGKSTTTKIVRFGIDKIPIRIYDIPGFEDDITIDKVNFKLIQTTSEMTTDKDKIHLILYFINNKEETLIYEMERKIIETLKLNNKDVRIIFVMTHSSLDPYQLQKTKQRKKLDIMKEKVKKAINVISSIFGEPYSYNSGYFEKDSIIQKNLIFVNLENDYENDITPFGFDKVIKSIYSTIIEGNGTVELSKINERLAFTIINKIKNDDGLNKYLEECFSKGYLLKHTSFAIQKEKAIKEAQKLYDNMFTLGKTILTVSPFLRDVKLGINKYQKYSFRKQLNRIFGFDIKDKNFDYNPNETDYEKMTRQYNEKKENEKKEGIVNEIKKDYNANEVNSTWIVSNEIAGLVCFSFLFGGPVLMAIGAAGVVGTSYVSYKQFKADCTEYFEQYKKHYEEYKYNSLFNFINSVLYAIRYLEDYIIKLDDNDNAAPPNANNIVEDIKKSNEENLKTALGKDKALENIEEIKNNIALLD